LQRTANNFVRWKIQEPFTNQAGCAIIDIVNGLDAPLTQAVGILSAKTYPKIQNSLFYIQKPKVFEYKKVKPFEFSDRS